VATGRLPLWCVVEYIRQLEVRRITISLTRVVLVFGCCLKRLCGGFGLSLFVVASLLFFLAVFEGAKKFNSDVSKWITGAVTSMVCSKCTLSIALSVATSPSLWCILIYSTTRV
jgi:surface protein